MVTLKTLVEAQQVIDRLLAMHLDAVLQNPDFARKLDESASDRKRAYRVSGELLFAISPMLSREIEITNDRENKHVLQTPGTPGMDPSKKYSA